MFIKVIIVAILSTYVQAAEQAISWWQNNHRKENPDRIRPLFSKFEFKFSDVRRAGFDPLLPSSVFSRLLISPHDGVKASDICMTLHQSTCTLSSLRFGVGFIGPDEAEHMGVSLLGNRSLRELDLAMNPLGDKGAVSIARGVRDHPYLHTLDLFYTQIGDVGGQAVGEMLKRNKSLQRLNLSCNEMTDESAHAIAQGLVSNIYLQSLGLGGNYICEAGVKSIAHSLRNHDNLKLIHLWGNRINPDCFLELGSKIRAMNIAVHF